LSTLRTSFTTNPSLSQLNNSNDDDFIEAGLGGMGYSCRLYKKTIPNLLEVDSKLFFKKMSILQVAMFQNVLMDLKILKENQISLFFSMSFGIFCPF
jgi:hypothetical protein